MGAHASDPSEWRGWRGWRRRARQIVARRPIRRRRRHLVRRWRRTRPRRHAPPRSSLRRLRRPQPLPPRRLRDRLQWRTSQMPRGRLLRWPLPSSARTRLGRQRGRRSVRRSRRRRWPRRRSLPRAGARPSSLRSATSANARRTRGLGAHDRRIGSRSARAAAQAVAGASSRVMVLVAWTRRRRSSTRRM